MIFQALNKTSKGLEIGAGCISAVTNVTHSLARKVFDDLKKKNQTLMKINLSEAFDKYNLISALHSFLSTQDDTYKKVLPPLILLSDEEQKELILKTKNLKFLFNKGMAA